MSETLQPSVTELNIKQRQLADFLLGLAYGVRTLAEQEATVEMTEPDIHENYMMDADDILRTMPHLFSLDEVERLEALGYFRDAPRDSRPAAAQRR